MISYLLKSARARFLTKDFSDFGHPLTVVTVALDHATVVLVTALDKSDFGHPLTVVTVAAIDTELGHPPVALVTVLDKSGFAVALVTAYDKSDFGHPAVAAHPVLLRALDIVTLATVLPLDLESDFDQRRYSPAASEARYFAEFASFAVYLRTFPVACEVHWLRQLSC